MTSPSKTKARDFKYTDPFAVREAEKYERPIPSRELIIQVLKSQGVPLRIEEIAAILEVYEEEDIIEEISTRAADIHNWFCTDTAADKLAYNGSEA